MPLRALHDNKDFFADRLTESNRKDVFHCPNCTSRLIPIIPKQGIIKHFRHKDGKSHYEPETAEHLNGKQVLFNIASKLGLNAIPEYRIGEHVTDVFVKGRQPIAIEFQCSKCHSKQIAERNLTYLKEGVVPLWILGASFYNGNPKRRITRIEKEIEQTQVLIYYINGKFRIARNKVYYNDEILQGSSDQSIDKIYTFKVSSASVLRLFEDFDILWHLKYFNEHKITKEKPKLFFKLSPFQRYFKSEVLNCEHCGKTTPRGGASCINCGELVKE